MANILLKDKIKDLKPDEQIVLHDVEEDSYFIATAKTVLEDPLIDLIDIVNSDYSCIYSCLVYNIRIPYIEIYGLKDNDFVLKVIKRGTTKL